MLEMGYVESLSGFEENFISGLSQDAELDFYDSNIVFLEESVFRPVVEILMQGSGSIVVGSRRDNMFTLSFFISIRTILVRRTKLGL